ncbi:ShlB/FhaC/HecB family hemolysin secretion/activation protein [Zobellella iuensis]|uniref:ShlB/FhaC/HecB family hemolysin secretion/activation protein n=1 Tax=Zobellella iuensis TaxID=2803811 RepID=A0ABS1QR60_9GAMM|nr:ShlB/FhaC/HecB family hemolysin secretion/activation protein [Zobellella iuensis]MBL1376608.1 ShlB/FhaC/HecB family hemolysin secretion/activation protein [Zobellella iuensis]
MRAFSRWLIPGAALLPLVQAMAEVPVYLNSNNVDNVLPSQNLPADSYQPATAQTSLPTAGQTQSLPSDTLIQLDNVLIEGGTVYPFDEIAAPFSALIGQQVTLKQLVDITGRITQRYKDDGYALSYAFIPAQNLSFGQVRIVLVEGYVADHELRGEVGAVAKRIRQFAAHIVNERPLRQETFERYTALMAQLPGVKVKATVPPPTTTDGAVTLLTEASRQAVTVTSGLELDSQDDAKLLLSAGANSHTAAGEQVKVTTMLPPGDDRERYARIDYSQFVGDQGTKLVAFASAYRSEKQDLENINPEGPPVLARQERKNDRVSVGVTHPIKLTAKESLTAGARLYAVNDERLFKVRESELVLPSDEAEINSQVRAVALEGEWRQAEQDQLRILSGGLYQGLDILGANSEIRQLNGSLSDYKDVDFLRFRISGMQTNLFADRWQSLLSGAFYWSGDDLPSSEQVAFGGRSFGRGYPSDQAEGDKGWGLGYELGYRFYPQERWLRLVQPYGALDTARASYNGSGPDAELGSYALGVRFSDQRHYHLTLEAAKPFGDRAIDSLNRDPRFRFNISYNL